MLPECSRWKYYLISVLTIVFKTSFWKIVSLYWKRPIQLNIGNSLKYYVSSLMDVWTLKEVVLDDCYKLYKKNYYHTVVDVGAGVGDFSIVAAKRASIVYALEIERERIMLLRKNIHENDIKNIRIVSKKISSIDLIVRMYKLNNIDLLKIDCEGCEYEIIKNTSIKILKRINNISMEIHLFDKIMENNFVLVEEKLRQADFSLSIIKNPVHSYLLFLYARRK